MEEPGGGVTLSQGGGFVLTMYSCPQDRSSGKAAHVAILQPPHHTLLNDLSLTACLAQLCIWNTFLLSSLQRCLRKTKKKSQLQAFTSEAG